MIVGYASSRKAYERAVAKTDPAAWLNIKRSNATDETDVFIYDEISYFGISAQQVADRIAQIDTELINIRINSPGGFVSDGVAIYNLFRQHKARKNVYIDGMAASIASVIAMAGDKIHIADNALMMIHDPHSIVVGNASALRKEATVLDAMKDTIIRTYQAHSSLKTEELAAAMAEETWYKAEEAVAAGLAHDVVSATPGQNFAKFDLSDFSKLPSPGGEGNDSAEKRTPVSLLRRRQAFHNLKE